MIREKPILFNTYMVRAILDGRKIVTRRKIDIDIVNQFDVEHDGKTVTAYINQETGDCYSPAEICRYQLGDILYVRETFCPNYFDESIAGYRGDGLRGNRNAYKADYNKAVVGDAVPEPKWHPSIHMPKEAARIWLKVTDVRVERLQNMVLDDFLNEGISIPYEAFNDPENAYMQSKMAFIHTWDSTISKEQHDLYGWDANPWVWVIEFKNSEKPEGEFTGFTSAETA